MGKVLSRAEMILAEAERMDALALGEKDKHTRQIMFAAAARIYLLHDRLLRLGQIAPGRTVGSPPVNGP